MITYLTVIFKNYDLLELQRDNLTRLLPKDEYKLLIVDNTPDSEKIILTQGDNELIVYRNSVNEFDGISHGAAIDYGLEFVDTDIVCIIDSDFFLTKNPHSYIIDKFDNGYVAVGADWDDGDGTRSFSSQHPDKFEDIPCCFCAYYALDVAKSGSWIVAPHEINHASSFIEVGWRIRKYILENSLKTLSWKCNTVGYANCIFQDENANTIGVHYVAGSHRRRSGTMKTEIWELLLSI